MASKLLRVNSKYRTPNSKSNTDFTVNIQTRDLENISRCVLLSATIPRMFGNVYEPNNVLSGFYSVSPQIPAQPFSVVIPAGSYTSVTLAAALNTALIVLFPFMSVSFDETRRRMKVEATLDKPPLFDMYISSDDPLAGTCGFTQSIVVGAQSTAYAQSATSLQGISQVYIELLFIGNRSCLDILENGLSIPLVTVVGCGSIPEGFDINYEATNPDCWMIDYNVENTGLANLRTIDIRVCDTFGNILPLPPNQNVDFVFRVYK